MHTKQKGVIGFWEIATELSKLSLPVFIEMSDLSKVDIITIYKDKPIKIQVKYIKLGKDGSIFLRGYKSGPNNYQVIYSINDVDLFAIYVPEKNIILYISSKFLLKTNGIGIRINDSKNHQKKKINPYTNYLDLIKILNTL